MISTTVIVGSAVFVALLVASAVVSGSEVALLSLDEAQKESLGSRSDRASRHVLALLARPQHLLITILVLNTLVNVSAAILAALATERAATSFGLSRGLVFALEVVALTFVLLVVSEISPKLIASRHAVAYSRRVAGLLRVASVLLYPLVSILATWMDHTQRGFKALAVPAGGEKLSPEDLKVMAEIGTSQGTIEKDEQDWIHSILELGDTAVRSIMVNRLDMAALSVQDSLEDALELIRTTGHSRLPLYIGHLDNILGIVYAKDLLPYLSEEREPEAIDWSKIMRPPMFVPESKKLDALLQDFQAKKTHLAIVVDEYGGTEGLVTMEDVMEVVVGDIQDEHDSTRESLVESLGDGRFRVDARIDLDDLNDHLKVSLDTEEFDFETLGGLIFNLAGDIPEEGYETSFDRLHLVVDSLVNNRIGLVRVQVIEEDPVQEA